MSHRLWARGGRPTIDDLLAAPICGDGGADLAAFGEVALELGAHFFEAGGDQAIDMNCRFHGSELPRVGGRRNRACALNRLRHCLDAVVCHPNRGHHTLLDVVRANLRLTCVESARHDRGRLTSEMEMERSEYHAIGSAECRAAGVEASAEPAPIPVQRHFHSIPVYVF